MPPPIFTFERSIVGGDPLEYNRDAIEDAIERGLPDFNAQSPSLSDHRDIERESDDLSVEYPRHGGAHSPLPFNPYSSYGRADGGDFDDLNSIVDQPQTAAYASYRDDSYAAGETISTAGHHASGVTLRTGFQFGRRSPGSASPASPANGEYDPQRPVQHLLDHRGHMSMFDDTMRSNKTDKRANTSARNRSLRKSKDPQLSTLASQIIFDPVIVDDTAEIDHAIESGHLQLNNIPPIPQTRGHPREDDAASVAGSETSSLRRSEPPTPRRTRLTDALGRSPNDQHAPFSPKRQAFSALSPRNTKFPPTEKTGEPPSTSANPSTGLTRFGRMAQAPTKEAEKGRKDVQWTDAALKNRRNPLVDIANQVDALDTDQTIPSRARRPAKTGNRSVYLPDVTGLTSAVGSPAKADVSYMGIRIDYRDPASVNAAIEELAVRLQQVARENTTSRRRVRELELELDVCKAEVTRERSKIQEEIQKQQERSFTDKKGKGKAEAANEFDAQAWKAKFQEVVEEKKALQALVNTLNTRLARTTTDLEASQQLIQQLKALRERDAADVRQKCDEIELLREEVERLTDEIGRLKSVVEDGLRERRMGREIEEMRYREGQDRSGEYMGEETEDAIRRQQLSVVEEEHEEEGSGAQYGGQPGYDGYDTEPEEDGAGGVGHETLEYTLPDAMRADFRPQSASGSVSSYVRSASAMSGGYGTQQTSQPPSRGASPRFGAHATSRPSSRAAAGVHFAYHGAHGGDVAAFKRPISRMSTKTPDLQHDDDTGSSMSSVGRSLPGRSRRFISDEELARLEADVEERRSERSANSIADDRSLSRASDPGVQNERPRERTAPKAKLTRHHSSPPTASHHHHHHHHRHNNASGAAPVPRIRGERVEKLFWSSSRHNEKTCTKCHKRKDSGELKAKDEEWLSRFMKRRRRGGSDVDEGDVGEEGERLPPQTVLSRVVRELEDEFTHYKSIYIELAEQYALMDAASNVAKRNVLAEHLREVIDVLEQKGDQIASLYDLLAFKDKPARATTS